MQIASNTYDRLYGDLATLHSNQFGVLFIGNWQMPGRRATLGEQKKKKRKRGKGRGSLHPSRPISIFAPPHAYPAFLPLDVKEAEMTATQLWFRKCRYSPVLNLNKQVSNILASYKHVRIYNNASEKPRREGRPLSDDQFLSSLQCKSIFWASESCLFIFFYNVVPTFWFHHWGRLMKIETSRLPHYFLSRLRTHTRVVKGKV